MPRFFFDFAQAGVRTRDDDGLEFASVEQAYLEAAEAAQEMWSDLMRKRQDPRQCYFEVRDTGGNLLFVFAFQELLDACTNHKSKPAAFQRSYDQVCATATATREACKEFQREVGKMRNVLKEARALLASDV